MALRTIGVAVVAVLALGAGLLGLDRSGGVTEAAVPTADAARLDAALARAVRRTAAPGATAAVVEDGELAWAGASGRARARPRAGLRAGSLFPIASTTKTVTATLAMGLSEEGALQLDRQIHDALPSLPGSRRITPRLLMGHSSGLSDYFADGAVDRIARRHPYHRWTRREVLSHVHGLKFAPGSRHGYSNSGYVALGGVIERASGERVEQLFQRLVAEPLGLREATFRYGGAARTRFAHPLRTLRGGRYRDRFGGRARVPTDYWGGVWTDGGLAIGSAGLARIGNAVYVGDLLAPGSVEEMLPPRTGGWGLGTFDKRALSRTWIGHDGSYGGYQSENWTDPDRDITVVAMTNAAGAGAVSPRIWRAVAAAYESGRQPPGD